jgi:hypothetical protein
MYICIQINWPSLCSTDDNYFTVTVTFCIIYLISIRRTKEVEIYVRKVANSEWDDGGFFPNGDRDFSVLFCKLSLSGTTRTSIQLRNNRSVNTQVRKLSLNLPDLGTDKGQSNRDALCP